MEPDEYEKVVRDIVESLFRQVENITPEQIKHGRESLCRGASTFPHQIDVLAAGGGDIILVECKRWAETVDVPSFLTFLARILDIRPVENERTIHAVMVTTKGFESGVKTLASYYNIDLRIVHSATEFIMSYKHFQAIGVGERGAGTNNAAVVSRICDECGSELACNDGQSYSCPRCRTKDAV